MSARVIKGTGAPPAAGKLAPDDSSVSLRIVRREAIEARAEGAHFLSRAREEGARLIEEASAAADGIREQAHREGYEEGLAQAQEILLAFQERRDKLFHEHRETIIRLAVTVAGKVLGREVERNDEVFQDLLISSVRRIRHERRIQIRVNPANLARARAAMDRLRPELTHGAEVEFREDISVADGGCIVETELGIIDARLDTQLKALERALLAARPT